jgi:arylsulfatase A-like enzyme
VSRRAAAFAAIAAALAAAGWAVWRRASTQSRPNVVMIVMDTTRADRCSFQGYERPTTPRLDELARDAVVFTEAWSPAGWTGPAHASLFTGLRLEHHGFFAGNRMNLAPTAATLAELLSVEGYATASFANNGWFDPRYGLTRGFQHAETHAEDETRPYPWARATHAAAAAWAEARAKEGRPFFLFVNDMEPHLPYTPPADDEARFVPQGTAPGDLAAARAFDFPTTVSYCLRHEELPAGRIELLSALYDAEIAALDREIGALLDRLRAAGLLDDAVVVVAGDHGEMLGEEHQTAHGFSLHRAVRHVPLIVRAPDAFTGGRREGAVVRLEDVMPTVLELCGARVPGGLDGASLLHDLPGRVSRALQGDDDQTRRRIESLIDGVDARPLTVGMRAVFDGRYHCIAYSDGRRQLFDVRSDPAERDDLSAREPAESARLAALLEDAR